jgi:hypothetical protein
MKLKINIVYHFIFNQNRNTYDKIHATFKTESLKSIIKTPPFINMGNLVLNQINIHKR